MKPLRIVPVLLALGGAALLIPAAGAQPRPVERPVRVASPSIDVIVHGSARPTYWAGGERFVEGRLGERYAIRIHNPTWHRVEAVVAVDGRDVIDGRPSSLNKRGYVIPPHGFVDIDGFRLSNRDVAAFRFSRVEDSYAARMGTPYRIGVIDVALFRERAARRPVRPTDRTHEGESRKRGNRSAPSAAPPGLGTEFGEQRFSPVRETHFERESWSYPTWQRTLRYDDRQGLCERGVQSMCPAPPPWWHEPRPFAQPPPGWRG